LVDTNKLNANNQEMFDVHGGIYWGWNVELQSTSEPSSLVLACRGDLLALALFIRQRRRAS
jgi:hypothetical protein